MPTAFITGIAGQDGGYLSEWLLTKGYDVHGVDLPEALEGGAESEVRAEPLDIVEPGRLAELLEAIDPDEVYHLAAPSFIPESWRRPVESGEATGIATARLLEDVRARCPRAKVFLASTSELFGRPDEAPQSEQTVFRPRNPYGVAKLYAYWMGRNYREHHGLFCCSGILYNHESPRRPERFVTRKVAIGAARIARGLESRLTLGTLETRRDWGFAGDYVQAMWLMLQQDEPDDYVIATGQTHTIRELCEAAFGRVGLDCRDYVETDPELARAPEAVPLVGNPAKAKARLGWTPSVSFRQLVEAMVDAELALLG